MTTASQAGSCMPRRRPPTAWVLRDPDEASQAAPRAFRRPRRKKLEDIPDYSLKVNVLGQRGRAGHDQGWARSSRGGNRVTSASPKMVMPQTSQQVVQRVGSHGGQRVLPD